MARPKIIHIPLERPERCNECPLLGIRPPDSLETGEKYTLKCFLPGYEKNVSGRGSKQKNARFRCKPKEYERVVVDNNGDVEISATDYTRYKLGRWDWLLQRDTRIEQEQNGTST